MCAKIKKRVIFGLVVPCLTLVLLFSLKLTGCCEEKDLIKYITVYTISNGSVNGCEKGETDNLGTRWKCVDGQRVYVVNIGAINSGLYLYAEKSVNVYVNSGDDLNTFLTDPCTRYDEEHITDYYAYELGTASLQRDYYKVKVVANEGTNSETKEIYYFITCLNGAYNYTNKRGVMKCDFTNGIIAAINGLGETPSEQDVATLLEVKAELTEEETTRLTTNDATALNTLAAAVKTFTDPVETLIGKISDDVTLKDAEAIDAAQKAYDALSDELKKEVSEDAVTKLTAASSKVTELKEAASAVEEQINNLPQDVTLDDADAVKAAQDAYDALSEEQKALISAENQEKLTAAEKTIADLKAASETPSQPTTPTTPTTNNPTTTTQPATVTAPARVTLKKVKKAGTKKAKLTWKKLADCSGYEVWVKKGKGKFKLCKSISSASTGKCKVAKIKKSVKYTFKVRAYKLSGTEKVYGAFSNTKKIVLK